jgi:hypothetical protein
MDLCEEWLNGRYLAVLESSEWSALRARFTLQTTAAYQSASTNPVTDTVTLTVGSTAVTGSGTNWPSTYTGMRFYRQGDTAIYTATILTATTLTLDRPYEGHGIDAAGVVYAGSSYVFMRNVYALPADCRAVLEVMDADTGYPLVPHTPAELDLSAGPRTIIDYPKSWAVVEDTPQTQPPAAPTAVVHQIELYPPPRLARGYSCAYTRDPNLFNGINLNTGPLPFVTQSVLLYGARADLALWQGKLPQAAAYEASFNRELKQLQLVDASQRKQDGTLRMSSRFTRHRMERAARGYYNGWGGSSPD